MSEQEQPQLFPPPGQMPPGMEEPTPEQIAEIQRRVAEDAQKAGMSVPEFIEHIKKHYYGSHGTINPTLIVPKGPEIDYGAPHDRGRFGTRKIWIPPCRRQLSKHDDVLNFRGCVDLPKKHRVLKLIADMQRQAHLPKPVSLADIRRELEERMTA